MLQLFLSETIKRSAFLLYCLCSWSLIALFIWSLWRAGRDGVAQLQRLHQIPCAGCAFFTRDYRLKCTVHPVKALSEEAINCLDYEPTTSPVRGCSKRCQQSEWSIAKNTSIFTNSAKETCLRANS